MKDVALVVDEYKNEIFFGETVRECQIYCDEHNITGENGEYIAIGIFDEERRCFEIEDYAEIENGRLW
jgi:hypothetical protein